MSFLKFKAEGESAYCMCESSRFFAVWVFGAMDSAAKVEELRRSEVVRWVSTNDNTR